MLKSTLFLKKAPCFARKGGITLEGGLVLKSTLFFKKAYCFARKGPFCNVTV